MREGLWKAGSLEQDKIREEKEDDSYSAWEQNNDEVKAVCWIIITNE